MATVTSGTPRTTSPAGGSSWTGAPAAMGVSQRRNAGQLDAFGITPDEAERLRQQTGVAQGGQGYVSGQVPPSGQAMAALNPPPQRTDPAPNTGRTPPPGEFPVAAGTQPVGPGQAPALIHGQSVGAVPADIHGQPALNLSQTGAAPTGRGAPIPGTDANGATTTTQSAITTPGAGGMPGAGTTPGPGSTAPPRTPPDRVAPTQVTGGRSAPAPVGNGTTPGTPLGSTGIPEVDRFLTPKLGDVGPAVASQRAAFGLSDDLSQERFDYRPGAAAAQDRVALDTADADQTRARQQQALDSLTAAANGSVPSAAELQMRREAGRNVAATLGQARALGGRSAGGAARAGTLASADILARNTMDAAQMRAAEQDVNRRNLTAALGGVRGQDVETASADARLAQDANANNLRAQIEQNELAERHRQALLEQQLKALGIGSTSGNAVVGAGGANADRENKFTGGGLGAFGDVVSAIA